MVCDLHNMMLVENMGLQSLQDLPSAVYPCSVILGPEAQFLSGRSVTHLHPSSFYRPRVFFFFKGVFVPHDP